MIRAALYRPASSQTELGGDELIDAWRQDNDSWLWLDIFSDPGNEIKALLQTRFGLDELAINDAFRERHPPKIESFDEYVFVLARGLDSSTRDINYKTIQLSFFFGPRLLISYRFSESLSIDRIWRELENGEISQRGGPVTVTCKILRAVVDRYTPILLNLEKRLEELEDEIFTAADDSTLEELVTYNCKLKKMRRTLTYLSNVTSEMERLPAVPANKGHRHLVHDVYEQFDRLRTMSDLFQELVVDLMNGYLSLSAHRLNQIMKVLTVFTVIFLPLTLMVGIYGMNFEYIPELGWRYGYFALLGGMATVVLVAVVVFRWKRWL